MAARGPSRTTSWPGWPAWSGSPRPALASRRLRRLLAQAFDLVPDPGKPGLPGTILACTWTAVRRGRAVADARAGREVLGAPTAQGAGAGRGRARDVRGARPVTGPPAPRPARRLRPTAHRFVVASPGGADREQRQVISVDRGADKPAAYPRRDLRAGHGMRVGRQLHVALTSVVGLPAQRQGRGRPGAGRRRPGDRAAGRGSRLGDTSVLAGVAGRMNGGVLRSTG